MGMGTGQLSLLCSLSSQAPWPPKGVCLRGQSTAQWLPICEEHMGTIPAQQHLPAGQQGKQKGKTSPCFHSITEWLG